MERIAGEVERQSGRFGIQRALAGVVAAWPRVVGDAIARNAWPARLSRDGTLHVHTSSSSWAFELQQLEPAIRERLVASLGVEVPRRLRFAVGRLPEPAAAEEGSVPPPSRGPSAEALRAARDLVAGVSDAELAERIARAAALSLSAAGSSRRF